MAGNGKSFSRLLGLWPAPVHSWWRRGSGLLWRPELLDWLEAEGSLNPLLARCPSPSQLDHCDGELDCDYSKSNCLDQSCCLLLEKLEEKWQKITSSCITAFWTRFASNAVGKGYKAKQSVPSRWPLSMSSNKILHIALITSCWSRLWKKKDSERQKWRKPVKRWPAPWGSGETDSCSGQVASAGAQGGEILPGWNFDLGV